MKLNVNLELREEVRSFLVNAINMAIDGWEGGEGYINIDLEEGEYYEGKELELGLELRDVIGGNKLIGEIEFNEKFKVKFEIEKTLDLLLEGNMKKIK